MASEVSGDPFIHIASHLPLIEHLYLSRSPGQFNTAPLAAFRRDLNEALMNKHLDKLVPHLDGLLIKYNARLFNTFITRILDGDLYSIRDIYDNVSTIDILVPRASDIPLLAQEIILILGMNDRRYDDTYTIYTNYGNIMFHNYVGDPFSGTIADNELWGKFVSDIENNWYDGKKLHVENVEGLRYKRYIVVNPHRFTMNYGMAMYREGYKCINPTITFSIINWVKVEGRYMNASRLEIGKMMTCKIRRLTLTNPYRVVNEGERFNSPVELLDYLEDSKITAYRYQLERLGLPQSTGYIGDGEIVTWGEMRTTLVERNDQTPRNGDWLPNLAYNYLNKYRIDFELDRLLELDLGGMRVDYVKPAYTVMIREEGGVCLLEHYTKLDNYNPFCPYCLNEEGLHYHIRNEHNCLAIFIEDLPYDEYPSDDEDAEDDDYWD